MIVGIGVDSVDIQRFMGWGSFSHHALRRIFSEQEIAYCLEVPAKQAERFAVRFAVREAFFKAVSGLLGEHTLPFLTLCKHVSVIKQKDGKPVLAINWLFFSSYMRIAVSDIHSHVSLSHTDTVATAFVILEKI